MEDSDFAKIHEQCASFRQALILDSDGSADHALAVASCLLRQAQHIYRAVGGSSLESSVLQRCARKAGELSAKRAWSEASTLDPKNIH